MPESTSGITVEVERYESPTVAAAEVRSRVTLRRGYDISASE
ncbi:MAG TPA: hypothetical protein VNV13_04615 [Steroidobacteraceae bacterium]|nr:hypothetical protein [Steroidobacteraceae bacterium]